MIKSFIAFLLTGLVMACASSDRDDAVIPAKPIDYTVGLVGKYPVTFLRDAGRSMDLPQGETTGEFEVSKVDSVTIFIRTTVEFKASHYSYRLSGKYGLKPSPADPKQFTLLVITSSLSSPSQATGTISPTEIEQQFVGSYEGDITQFKGKRG
ncbi:hypothetical protein [Spirosoma endophyticum]|uniref:Lipoprotein n=1 Tax=Spirosoma endophyticum TaxID=662367 RepID=A0A1I2HK69_9BACT|nr:hypothetical protein [Spirosoma endophyticum]SFF30564.1 hypothetical protein SAMN05216167_1456 [Spirosoma endophyticum]